ncbi:MAG TPA: glutamine amidotransferase [Solirubrobacteraceae bacterium]|nr:glutamine amidotransferase [Solirubrobacteraceae bacterium]
MTRALRVCALYPDLMNIYADRGNLLMLERRCAWRSIGFELHASGLGDRLEDGAHDIYYLGGGQDSDQRRCAEDLLERKADGLRAAAAGGAIVLGVCGGYQLLGRSYALGDDTIEGVGLLDVETTREDRPRLIGNVAIELTGAASMEHDGMVLAGFENHGGRTALATGQTALGRVIRGHGNDGHSGYEGARTGNVIGTYLHGPLLPKNSWFCDWLIAAGLGLGGLEPLDDGLEREAHAAARRAAGV